MQRSAASDTTSGSSKVVCRDWDVIREHREHGLVKNSAGIAARTRKLGIDSGARAGDNDSYWLCLPDLEEKREPW